MNKKAFLKNLLEQCKNGYFEEILEIVNENENCLEKLDQTSGIKLLIGCCNACIDIPKSISEEHLYKFLRLIVSSIRDPNETDQLRYIQSIFHILNMLVHKNCYSVIMEMENILMPPFLSSAIPKDLRDIYDSIVIILHNLVAKCASENDRNHNESLISICTLILKICSKMLGSAHLINRSYKCFSNLLCLKISVDEQRKFFENVLLLIDSNEIQPKLEECFKYILCYSTIILHNMLKIFDFKQAFEFCDRIFNLVKENLIHEEYVHLVRLLKSCFVISPVELKDKFQTLKQCCESMRILDKMWSDSENGKQVREKILALIQTISFYYKSCETREWLRFSEALQLEILNFVASVSTHNFMHIQIILGLIEIYAQFGSDSTIDYHRNCLKLLKKFLNQINQLKQQQCEEWKKAWNIFGIGVFNIGFHLERMANEAALLYFNFLLTSYIDLECWNSETYLKYPTLLNCLKILCECHINKAVKYLGFSALAILLCPNNKEAFIAGWVKLKHNQRESKLPGFEDIQKITTVKALKILQQDAPELEIDLNDTDKLCLLKFELEQYKKRWKSKVPIMAAVQDLCELSNLEKVVEAIVEIFGDHVLSLHENCLENFTSVLFKFRDKVKHTENKLKQVHLALLYHICYKYNMRQIITKNALDMEWTSIVPIKLPLIIPRDPSEECDVVSSYESLTLEKFLCNLSNLDEALTILSKIIQDLNPDDNLECVYTTSLYDRLIQISHEYRLLRHRIRSLQASQLALKVAQLQNNLAGIVQASSFIIEFADVNKLHPKKQIAMVDTLLERTDFSKEQNLKIVMIYYICKCKALFSIDIQESYKTFQMAMRLMENHDNSEGLSSIKSQLHLLKFKFSSLPCNLEIEIHRKNTLMDVYLATAIMFDEYKKNHFENMNPNEREYETSVMLDASEELTRLYHLMKVPIEVRTYGRETFLLTQKLVLPLRCSTYLMYLAHADLMSSRLKDCQVKIDGMAKILSLHKSEKSKIMGISQKKSSPSSETVCNNNSVEIVLDLPIHDQFSPSSPKFVVQSFHIPTVAKHKKSCCCFYCICFEYQTLLVEQTRLSALMSVKQNNFSIAQSYFEGALYIYNYFSNKWDSNDESITEFIHHDLIPEYKKEFLSSYGYTLLNFSSHLRRMKSKTESFSTNDKLIDILSTSKLDHAFLYNEAIGQKLGYLTEKIVVDPLHEIQNDMEFLSVNDNEEVQKTPESKRTQISIPVKPVSPSFSPLVKPVKKCLLFDLSPENPTESFKGHAPHSNLKTPARRIQIYTDTSERKTRQKKPQLSSNVKVRPSDETVTSATCDTEVESALKPRTRLLTEKLKQTSKKNETASKPEGKSSGRVPSCSKKSVIKNLLEEFPTFDNDRSNSRSGAIRKSTRNKK